jgi:DNA-binding response OmpR family regulator
MQMLHQKRILCVEDDLATAQLITWLLRDYQVIPAATKADALRLVSDEDSFALYILDNNLPDGLGVDVCAFIRGLDQKTPIIFATSDDSLTKDRLEEIGAQRLVRKGLNFSIKLETTVSDLLEKTV